jgi:hypothetical protein
MVNILFMKSLVKCAVWHVVTILYYASPTLLADVCRTELVYGTKSARYNSA